MKEKEFGKVIDLLVGAYGSKMEMTEDRASAYYLFLKKYHAHDVWDACYNWIKNNRFAPAISDLVAILEERYE